MSERAGIQQGSADAEWTAGHATFVEGNDQRENGAAHADDDDALEGAEIGGLVIKEKHHNRGDGGDHAEQM